MADKDIPAFLFSVLICALLVTFSALLVYSFTRPSYAPMAAHAKSLEAAPAPVSSKWWIARASLTGCIETDGPAAKLDDFVGFNDRPSTEDFTDSNGTLVKVNVVNSATNGMIYKWSFYRNKAACEAEQINATKALADRYR